MTCAKFSWNWPGGCGEEDFLNLSMYFYNFRIISTWKRTFIWSKDALCEVWLKLAYWFWRRRGKCEKITTVCYNNDDDNDDHNNNEQRSNFDQKSSLGSGELKMLWPISLTLRSKFLRLYYNHECTRHILSWY